MRTTDGKHQFTPTDATNRSVAADQSAVCETAPTITLDDAGRLVVTRLLDPWRVLHLADCRWSRRQGVKIP